GIVSVAMQSTGVYWIPLYDVLEEAGFEVYLVNARDTKNLPGRKSDVQESQWLLKLHTYGLLRNSFRPASEIRVLRTYWRQRSEQIHTAAECVQRMQKALTQMNLQLANVITDIMGLTGQKILRAILAGERDADKLAEMRNWRIQASHEEIVASLTGNWRSELLFTLKQEVDRYDFCQRQMGECDQEIEKQLNALPSRPRETVPPVESVAPPKKRKKAQGNSPEFDLGQELVRIAGVDFTRIDGINVMTAQTIISEVGLDMERWKSEAHFASWLGLCPYNAVSGGKVLRRGTRKVVNRSATALRIAAFTLRRSDSYLGAQYRRFRRKLGAPKAITAMAHKLAVLFYRMLRFGQEYVDRGQQFYEDKYRQQQISMLNKKAAQLGGFFVEHRYLLLAVLVFVELLTPVDVFLSEAQHAVEQDCQFVGHGRDRFGRPQFAAEAAILRSQVAVATPERESRDAEGRRRPVYYLARSPAQYLAAADRIVWT